MFLLSQKRKKKCTLISFSWVLRHRKYQILYKQSLKSCSVELILPQQPKAIRVTIHCKHSNQATELLAVFTAGNNSQVDPYVLSSMSANPTLIKVYCC